METNLRPLTLGEILDRTAQLYRSHFWLFAGIASVNSGARLLLNLLQIGGAELLRADHLLKYIIALGVLAAVIQILVSFVIGGIAAAANNRAVAWLHLGEPATIRGAYASILPRTARYAWLMVIITVKILLPMLVVYVASVIGLVFLIRPAARAAAHGGAGATAPPDPSGSLLAIAGAFVF